MGSGHQTDLRLWHIYALMVLAILSPILAAGLALWATTLP